MLLPVLTACSIISSIVIPVSDITELIEQGLPYWCFAGFPKIEYESEVEEVRDGGNADPEEGFAKHDRTGTHWQ